MEQALGNWAEDLVRGAIAAADLTVRAIAFGDNDKAMAQDADFADLYRAGKARELHYGKRSDLLLFDQNDAVPDDASTLDGDEAERLCRSCLAALEIRSSRTSAQRFIAHNERQKAAGKKPARMEPSITVKIEDSPRSTAGSRPTASRSSTSRSSSTNCTRSTSPTCSPSSWSAARGSSSRIRRGRGRRRS